MDGYSRAARAIGIRSRWPGVDVDVDAGSGGRRAAGGGLDHAQDGTLRLYRDPFNPGPGPLSLILILTSHSHSHSYLIPVTHASAQAPSRTRPPSYRRTSNDSRIKSQESRQIHVKSLYPHVRASWAVLTLYLLRLSARLNPDSTRTRTARAIHWVRERAASARPVFPPRRLFTGDCISRLGL